MNPKLTNEFSWIICENKDMTTYQLHNGILVDVQEVPPNGYLKIYVYRNGKIDKRAANYGALIHPADAIENLKDLNRDRHPFD